MRRLAPILAVLVLASVATQAWGQEQGELSLAIRRDFGFRSGDRMQSRFTLKDEQQQPGRSIEESRRLE